MTMALSPSRGTSTGTLAWLTRLLLRRRVPTLADLARRPDDRLLRDVGLTRNEALGIEGTFWREREMAQRHWSL